MTSAYLALGGNVGPVERTFGLALEQLDALPRTSVTSVSTVHRFPAVGANAGGDFCNAAAQVDTELQPVELLTALQRLEARHGRVKGVHWGPRPLDLDLVLFGDRIVDEPNLRVPHPACWYRRFVLDPLAEIAADVIHPEKHATVGELRERLMRRPLRVTLVGGVERLTRVAEAVSIDFPQVEIRHADINVWTSAQRFDAEPTLLIWLGADGDSDQFQSLPQLSRLDASPHSDDALEFIRGVLHSALGR